MTKFNLSVKIMTVMLLVTGIALLARQTRACSSCDPHGVMLSQNDQNMNDMNMKGMNMDGNNAVQPQDIPRGYALSPVSNTKVKITKDTPFTIIGDRKFYFASDQEKQEFLQDPQKYISNIMPKKGNKLPTVND